MTHTADYSHKQLAAANWQQHTLWTLTDKPLSNWHSNKKSPNNKLHLTKIDQTQQPSVTPAMSKHRRMQTSIDMIFSRAKKENI